MDWIPAYAAVTGEGAVHTQEELVSDCHGAATFLGQIVLSLPPHPELRVAPADALQGQSHRGRDATAAVDKARHRISANAQAHGALCDGPAHSLHAVANAQSRVRWIRQAHDAPSVVIDEVHVHCLAIFESEYDAPVVRYTNAPLASTVAGQRMQPEAGHVHVDRFPRSFKVVEQASDARRACGVKAAGVATFVQSAQPVVLESHVVTVRCNVTCVKVGPNLSRTQAGWRRFALSFSVMRSYNVGLEKGFPTLIGNGGLAGSTS